MIRAGAEAQSDGATVPCMAARPARRGWRGGCRPARGRPDPRGPLVRRCRSGTPPGYRLSADRHRQYPGAPSHRRQDGVPAAVAGAGHVKPPQLPAGPSRQAPTRGDRGGLLPDGRQCGWRRICPGAAARQRAGGGRRLPGPDQLRVPVPLPAGRRPDRLRRAVSRAATHLGGRRVATAAVRPAVYVPARAGPTVPMEWIPGPARLRRASRRRRHPGYRRGPDPPACPAVPEPAADRHANRAPEPGGSGGLPGGGPAVQLRRSGAAALVPAGLASGGEPAG